MILDTCALLWLSQGGGPLSTTALQSIDAAPLVYVSAISGFEVGIKAQKGKLELPARAVDWFDQHTRYEAMTKMQAARVPLTALNPPSAVLEDPHFRERGYFAEVDHPEAGPLPYTREPFRMGASPADPVRRAPLLGEHTGAVLQQRLNLDPTELADLRQQGVI